MARRLFEASKTVDLEKPREDPMHVVDPSTIESEFWRNGVETTVLISSLSGARNLCIFEQRIAEACGAPSHVHSDEEVLTVIEGCADVWVGNERIRLAPNQSVLIPANTRHQFMNMGSGTLRVRAVLSAPYFETMYSDPERHVVRWKKDMVRPER